MASRTKSKPYTLTEVNALLLEAARTGDTLLANLAAFAKRKHMRRIKRECIEGVREMVQR